MCVNDSPSKQIEFRKIPHKCVLSFPLLITPHGSELLDDPQIRQFLSLPVQRALSDKDQCHLSVPPFRSPIHAASQYWSPRALRTISILSMSSGLAMPKHFSLQYISASCQGIGDVYMAYVEWSAHEDREHSPVGEKSWRHYILVNSAVMETSNLRYTANERKESVKDRVWVENPPT